MAAWRYEISLRSLVKYFSTLEEKFRISAWPCNILRYLYTLLVFFNFFYVHICKYIYVSIHVLAAAALNVNQIWKNFADM